jgi:hypothetical protein
MLRSIHWYLVIDALGQPIGPTFKVQAVLGLQSKKCLTLTTLTTNQYCLTSQIGDDLIYTTTEAWGHWLLGIYHVPSTSTPYVLEVIFQYISYLYQIHLSISHYSHLILLILAYICIYICISTFISEIYHFLNKHFNYTHRNWVT